MRATLAQGQKILELATQKKLSSEVLDALFHSGILSDIFSLESKDQVKYIERLKFRLGIGLIPQIVRFNQSQKLDSPRDYMGWAYAHPSKEEMFVLANEVKTSFESVVLVRFGFGVYSQQRQEWEINNSLRMGTFAELTKFGLQIPIVEYSKIICAPFNQPNENGFQSVPMIMGSQDHLLMYANFTNIRMIQADEWILYIQE